MKIITLETLKAMPNGTVFCKVDSWGSFQDDIRILTGRFDDEPGFNGEMTLYPWIAGEDGQGICEMFDKNHELVKDRDIPTEWSTSDTADHDYLENQLYAVFSRAEIEKMIKALQWALSGLKDDFDMDEIIIGDKIIRNSGE